MIASPHILMVEDDGEIAALVTRYLEPNGLRVSIAGNGEEMDRILRDARIDLIVLDIMLPGEDGLSLCRRLRTASAVPIIMLTARCDEIDRIVGLELGADDYVGKPFNVRELLARIRVSLRRGQMRRDPVDRFATVLAFAGWQLNVVRRKLFNPEGAQVSLTGAEFDLLQVLCEHPGRPLSREQIIDLTQGRQSGPFERSVDILVSRLRSKLERDPRDPELIQTVRLSGYLFTPEVETR